MSLPTVFYPYIVIYAVLINVSHQKIPNPKGLPILIWWTDILFPHVENNVEINCPKYDCIVSKKIYHKSDSAKIAYIFYGTDFYGDNLPLPRKQNHIWALLHEESPMNNYIFSHSVGIKLFNYTSTFSRYSDFPLTTQFIPSLNYLTNRKPLPIEEKNAFRKNGTAPILYLQSHCDVASDRDTYVKELMKYIEVDSYGKCLNNKQIPQELSSTSTYNDENLFQFISKYKFHLALENALCDDYITEKLYRALHVGSVPVYKGSSSISDWEPSNTSIIKIDDFKTPLDLAHFLNELDRNDKLYENYLKFKNEGTSNELLINQLNKRDWGVNDPNQNDFIHGFECFVCDKMHNSEQRLSVANKSHMDCHQPHSFVEPSTNSIPNKLLQDWIENYWFAFDQARAIELMIQSKETSSANFVKYLTKLKYNNS